MGIATRARLCLSAPLFMFCAAALADNAMTTQPADLYAGPDNSYPVVAQLDPNTPVQVMGCLDDWSWCDVSVQDARGWMYSPAITYAYQDGYVPLYTYAPALGIAVVPFAVDVYWGRYYQGRPWYSRREEWSHRVVQHRRPSGPPPSASRPPRPEHREAARAADHPIHLGSAEQRGDADRHNVERHDADRHGAAGDNRNFSRPPAPPRPAPHAMPHAANPPHEAPREAPREAPHEAPHEEHAHPNPAPRAAAPTNQDHSRPEQPASPKREDNPH